MSPRYACKKDANHDEIANTFRVCGWPFLDTWQFAQYVPGFPDGLASGPNDTVLVEIKNGDVPLTPDEEEFHREWAGVFTIVVIGSVDEALDFMGMEEGA